MHYEVTLQTIAWFNQQRNNDRLVISPKFQRRPVWLAKERMSLLETVFSRLPFPEIYIQIETDPDSGSQKYIVVDGQQRITSLLLFIDGQITLPESSPWEGRLFADLDQPEKAQFWEYKIVVRQLSMTNDAEIRDLFARLNTNNISLNDQEIRNAKYMGKFKISAERLTDNPLFQHIALFTAREIRRMEDIEFVSELLLQAVEGITNKKELLEEAYANYDEEFPGQAEYEFQVNAALSLLQSLLTEENRIFVRTKSNFYSVFGACLRYLKEEKRTAFRRPDVIGRDLGRLLGRVKSFDPNQPDKEVEEYYNAVSRAASDRARRATRERILFELMQKADRATDLFTAAQ